MSTPRAVTIEANGQRGTFMVNAFTVANIAPTTTLLAQGPASTEADDGQLGVTLVAVRGLVEAVATTFHLATSALRRRPAERYNVGHFRTREVRVETREPRRVMVDGEDAMDTPVTVRYVPQSLRVLVPAGDGSSTTAAS